jgi:hypothetical protein
MRNIGPKSATLLRSVGIHSHDDLIAIGVVPAFVRVWAAGANPSLNLLWALEGAVQDTDWRDIPTPRKRQLSAELDRLMASEPR